MKHLWLTLLLSHLTSPLWCCAAHASPEERLASSVNLHQAMRELESEAGENKVDALLLLLKSRIYKEGVHSVNLRLNKAVITDYFLRLDAEEIQEKLTPQHIVLIANLKRLFEERKRSL